jgi:uncharacterized protein (TIGR00251 family)
VIRSTAGGVEFDVRVVPRSGRTEIGGTRRDAVLVRLAAPPVEGAANEALIAFLSKQLDAPRGAIQILSGVHSRQKRVLVGGLTLDEVRARLGI